MNTLPALSHAPIWSAFVEIMIIGALGFLDAYMLFLGKSKGMILEWYGKRIEGKFWAKPFGGCMICTSFWLALLNYGAFILGGPFTIVACLLAAAAVAVFLTNKLS